MADEGARSELIANRRARHDYEILETFEAGLVLRGTEVKSLRDHGGSLQESYVKELKGEVWLIGSSIVPYKFGNIYNHEERRDRKLLLHRREINKLHKALQEKGFSAVPLSLYLQKGKIKLCIGIGRGKKNVDKRQDLKQKDDLRRMQKMLKGQRE